jgi:hypothetical protein
MLVLAMRTNDSIEMRVIDGRSRNVYCSTAEIDRNVTNNNGLLNSNNNNNTPSQHQIHSQRSAAASGDDLSEMTSIMTPFDTINEQKVTTSFPNLAHQLGQLEQWNNRALSGSVPALATGNERLFRSIR